MLPIEMGLDTFGDITAGCGGQLLTHAQVIRNVVEEAVLADRAGVRFFGLGEHHRQDFAISSPEIVLGAIAGRTRHLRLGTAVTVLSTDDPVRLFERFSTLDALTDGRAECIMGRGWFSEPFQLFGQERSNSDALFESKLERFVTLLRQGAINVRVDGRPPLLNQPVFPPMASGSFKAWVAVGSSLDAVLRAARYDLPLMLAIIGGEPQRFRPFVDLYNAAFERLGRPSKEIGVHSVGYVAETDSRAKEAFWPYYKHMRDALGAERGWPALDRAKFDLEVSDGSLFVGDPETVAQKIAATVQTLGISRFVLKYSVGRMPHELLMQSIQLYGSKVIPRVHELLER